MRQKMNFSDRLQEAVGGYPPLFDRDISVDNVDPRRSCLQPVYQRFRDASHRLALPPDRGEWLDFESGRKPMLRLVLDSAEYRRLLQHSRDFGWVTALVDRSSSHEKSSVDPSRKTILLGREIQTVKEAARLDSELLDGRVTIDEWQTLGRRFGELLGYPSCCVEHFISLPPNASNEQVIRSIAVRSKRFEPWLNNLTMSAYHAICWFPCRYDCDASLRIARHVDGLLRTSCSSNHYHRVQHFLSMPRLVFDERRQMLFGGAVQHHGRVHYHSVYSLFSFDFQPSFVWTDWLFFIDVVMHFQQADWFEHHDPLMVIGKKDATTVEFRCHRSPTWMPFGWQDG